MKTKLLLILVITALIGCSSEETMEPNAPFIENTISGEQMPATMMPAHEEFTINPEGQIMESNIPIANNIVSEDNLPPHIISLEPTNGYIAKTEGQTVVFAIRFEGDYITTNIYLIFNSHQLLIDQQNVCMFRGDNGYVQIVLKNVKTEMTGEYGIRVSNHVGLCQANFRVQINSK